MSKTTVELEVEKVLDVLGVKYRVKVTAKYGDVKNLAFQCMDELVAKVQSEELKVP